jgi:hypothetical protein
MANSKLLKEAIADAKAVKETALANAKLALEEAFTPRLQSILSQKMRAEAEEMDMDDEQETTNEELSSTGIGSKVDAGYAETPGSNPTLDAMTDLSVGVKKDAGKPEQAGTDYKKVADISEEENPFADDAMAGDDKDAEIAELKARIAELEGGNDSEEDSMDSIAPEEGDLDNDGDHDMADHDMEDDSMDMDSDDQMSEDDMDLDSIIKELERQLEGEDSDENGESMYEAEETEKEEKVDEAKDETEEKEATNEEAKEDDKKEDDLDEVIDLEEILKEMEADLTNEAEESKDDEKEKELEEAYSTIKSLQKTINEVNLLNAKLLFANKLFRAHNMTNEQKVKVIETLDRTNSVREVKLVYSTLAENFKYTSSSNKIAKKSIQEGIASKVTKSTKPAVAEQKEVISENANFSDRFKKLAGIIK